MTRRRDDSDLDRVPVASDMRWEGWSKPLLDFLEEPRNWDEIERWALSNMSSGKLRNCIAWLEDARLVVCIGSLAPLIFWGQPGNTRLVDRFNSEWKKIYCR